MKTVSIFFVLIFVFSFLNSFSQKEVIQLKLKEGHEYVFEHVDNIYASKEDKSKEAKQSKTKEFRLAVGKVLPDESLEITFQYLENFLEKNSFNEIINRNDYFFPNFNEAEIGSANPEENIERFLSRSTLNFSVNLKTNEIELLNRIELLEQFHTWLNEQGFDRETVDENIETIFKKKFFVEEDLIAFLTWFNGAELNPDQTLTNSGIDGEFIFRERKGEFLNFSNQGFDKPIPGNLHKKYWINLENGIVTNFTTIKTDSIKSRWERIYNKNILQVHETDFRLLYSQKFPENKLFVSGEIEKPLSNKVHIKFLDHPFDNALKVKTVLLDKNGTFSTQVDYLHTGFVFVENENNNKHKPPGTYVFYAEPGDSIFFESTGTELPWKTSVWGNREKEAQLIMELRSEIHPHEDERKIATRSNLIFDRDFFSGISVVDGVVNRVADVDPLFDGIEKSEIICSKYKSEIPAKAYDFISTEVKAYFYMGLFSAGWVISTNKGIGADTSSDLKTLSRIDEIDIHENYNDYGTFSRTSVYYYLKYHFSKAQKAQHRFYTGPIIRVGPEPEMELQFSRMVLTGSPLYREIAKTMNQILQREPTRNPSPINTDYLTDFALANLKLITKKCNDLELVNKVNETLAQHKKLQPGNFIPELQLMDIKHKKVSINDFLGEKPTVFYFAHDWVGDRYEYDAMGKTMPEINFVMVVEGSNFKQWEEYTNLAEPAITHLFYLNDKKSFREIFQATQTHLVFNKTGELEGYAKSPKEAVRMAKESLELKKKEFDKSQLIWIIWILGIITFGTLIVFAIWKWRVRRRFRREQQQRRLRELELTAIRSQMNPHFLFNSLNSVQNLVQQNKGREAHIYLSDFAGLIRKVLQNSEKEEVSLAEELQMTEQYLNLEKLRFNFDFSISVDETIDANNTMVPSMLLQPFAENAVIHGLQSKAENRKLKIEITKEQTRLAVLNRLAHQSPKGKDGIIISIEDNGIGREAANEISKTKNGKGSKLIQERLETLQEKQGEKYQLEIIDLTGAETGTRVEIFIPEEK